MSRLLLALAILSMAGCADRSKGAALNECRLKYYLDPDTVQSDLIPDCMRAKSFEPVLACRPEPDPYGWDQQVLDFAYDNPRCYRPIGSAPWLASALSPM